MIFFIQIRVSEELIMTNYPRSQVNGIIGSYISLDRKIKNLAFTNKENNAFF
jgi:hypothetical protein